MSMKHSLRVAVVVASSIGTVVACGAGTGGAAVTVDIDVVGNAAAQQPFTTSAGWTITLNDAHVAVGPFYLQKNPPPLASLWSAPRVMLATLSSLVVPSAHAHAGDNQFNGGDVLAELTEYVVLDVLSDTPRTFTSLAAIAGEARSLEAQLPALADISSTASDGAANDVAALHGHQAYVTGTAVGVDADGNDVVVEFVGGTSPESDARRRVQGLPLDVRVALDSRIHIVVDPRSWLDDIDFSSLNDSDDDGVVEIVEGEPAAAAWSSALRSRRTFSLTIE